MKGFKAVSETMREVVLGLECIDFTVATVLQEP